MRTASAHGATELHYDPDYDADCADAKGTDTPTPGGGGDAKHPNSFLRHSHRRCTLTCCAPDGSPLQGTGNVDY